MIYICFVYFTKLKIKLKYSTSTPLKRLFVFWSNRRKMFICTLSNNPQKIYLFSYFLEYDISIYQMCYSHSMLDCAGLFDRKAKNVVDP